MAQCQRRRGNHKNFLASAVDGTGLGLGIVLFKGKGQLANGVEAVHQLVVEV
jgi:hypothetical protein